MTYLMKISKGQCQYHLISSQPCFLEITQTRVTLLTLHTGLSLFVISLSPFPISVTSFISLPTDAFNLLVFRPNFHTFSVAFTPPSHLTFLKSVYLHIPFVLSSYLCAMIQLFPTCIYLQKRLSSITSRCAYQTQNVQKKVALNIV